MVPTKHLREMLLVAGAQLFVPGAAPPASAPSSRRRKAPKRDGKLVVISDEREISATLREQCRALCQKPMRQLWVLDSISQCKPLPREGYERME